MAAPFFKKNFGVAQGGLIVLTLLSHLFVTERHRAVAGNVGLRVPLMSEIDVPDRSCEPLLVTNAKGSFLPTVVAKLGYVRFGFSKCSPDQEPRLLVEFHRVLVERSRASGWGNVVSSIDEGVSLLRSSNPLVFVVSSLEDPKLTEDGFVNLRCPLPSGAALLSTRPDVAGLYTRVGDSIGIVAKKCDTSFVAVTRD